MRAGRCSNLEIAKGYQGKTTFDWEVKIIERGLQELDKLVVVGKDREERREEEKWEEDKGG